MLQVRLILQGKTSGGGSASPFLFLFPEIRSLYPFPNLKLLLKNI